jgi:tRNA(fMet)-specific endonuclease VapC
VKYLLDTCTVSDYFRRVGAVADAMHALPPHQLAISTLTEHEIRFGLARQPRATALMGKVKSFLSVVQVLAFDSGDAAASAAIGARFERQPIGGYDLLIAGTAVARDLILVTSNEREFERVPALSVENWR